MENNEIVATLNELVEVNKNSEQSFKDAFDDIKNTANDENGASLKDILLQYSEHRGRLYSELQYVLANMGADVEFSGSIAGVMHRRWIDVRFGAAGSDAKAIIKECIKDEEAALTAYKEALKKGLPSNIKKLVERQYNEINAAYEDLLKSAAAQQS